MSVKIATIESPSFLPYQIICAVLKWRQFSALKLFLRRLGPRRGRVQLIHKIELGRNIQPRRPALPGGLAEGQQLLLVCLNQAKKS